MNCPGTISPVSPQDNFERELRSLFIRFARNIDHRHSFVIDECEFCKITREECKHGKTNKKVRYDNNWNRVEECECGRQKEISPCFHRTKFGSAVEHVGEDDDDEHYEQCTLCGKQFADNRFSYP